MNNLPSVPDDPFPDDLFMNADDYDPAFEANPFTFDAENLLPEDAFDLTESEMLPEDTPLSPPTDGEDWAWIEARLIGVERDIDDGVQYEIGCIDVYADMETGERDASYLPVAGFDDADVAAAFYHDLQGDMHRNAVPVDGIPQFAEDAARRMGTDAPQWRDALPDEYAAYDAFRDLLPDGLDEPPEPDHDTLIRTAADLTGLDPTPVLEDRASFQALSAIGIDADGFDPAKDPPPFYDAETGTAYWIGVFQADADDKEHCITSILSLGRNDETGEVEAQLAPCVPGDWDKTYAAAEFLINVAQRSGIDGCFDAAEGMALATEQRDLWETPLGLPLETDAAEDIAAYARDSWEVDL